MAERVDGRRSLLGQGAFAISVRAVASALAYAMVLSAAAVTDPVQFGYFGIAWAVHSLLFVVGTVGQHAVVMKLWPQWHSRGDRARANGLLVHCLKVACMGLGVVALSLCALAAVLLPFEGGRDLALLTLATMALTVVDGWAEVVSGAARARGMLALALLPRDIVWRMLAVMALTLGWALDIPLSATLVILTMAMTLACPVAIQTFALLRRVLDEQRTPVEPADKSEHRHLTLGLWGANSVPVLSGQMSTILVGLLLGPLAAGLYFAAEKTSSLLTLVAQGLNQVVAPRIAAAFATGDLRAVQSLSNQISSASAAFGVVALLVLAACSHWVMSAFDPVYGDITGTTTLLLLATGQVFAMLCAGSNSVLQMTGNERAFVSILTAAGILSLLLPIVLVPLLGVVGAASAAVTVLVVTNIAAVAYSRRALGVDPSIVGLFQSSPFQAYTRGKQG